MQWVLEIDRGVLKSKPRPQNRIPRTPPDLDTPNNIIRNDLPGAEMQQNNKNCSDSLYLVRLRVVLNY